MIKRGLWLGPVLLALLVNVNVLQNGFGWDDENILPNLSAKIRYQEVIFPDREVASYYRPLVTVSYLLDRALWGNNPFGFHLSVFLAHVLNTALVFFLARGLQRVQGFAPLQTPHSPLPTPHSLPLIAASLFAVHPIHAEAVAWIAGRNDVFCTTFLLVSLLLYIRSHPVHGSQPGQTQGSAPTLNSQLSTPFLFGLSMLFFFLALLTKETAIGLILLFPLYDYFVYSHPLFSPPPQGGGRGGGTALNFQLSTFNLLRWLIPLAIFGLYLWMRAGGITNPYGGAFSPERSPVSELWVAIRAYAYYFTMILFPYPHRPFIEALPDAGPSLFIGGLIALGSVAGLIMAVARRNIPVGIGLAWMLLLLVPAVAVALLGLAATPVAERYVYAPSAGIMIAAGGLIQNGLERFREVFGWPNRRVWAAAGILWITLLAMWGWESWNRNAVWRSPLTFWETATKSSGAGYPHGQLGIQYTRLDRYAEAEEEFRTALRLVSHPAEKAAVLSNLGSLYTQEGRFSEAETVLREAFTQAPENDEILYHLSQLYFKMSVREKREESGWVRVTAYDPDLFSQAERYLEQALGLQPMLPLLLEAGKIYMSFGKWAEAESYFQRVVSASSDPNSAYRLKAQEQLDRLRSGLIR